MDSATLTGNGVVNGVIGSGSTTANTSTFSTGDKIAATGSNNTLNIVDVSGSTALPSATTVSGVQTVNLTSGAATGAANFSGFTGLTQLNVTETGGAAGITAAATTNVTLTDSAPASSSVTVSGTTTPATGAVIGGYTLQAGDVVTSSVDNINVQGGANVSVTANGVTSQTVVTTGAVVDAVVANTINVGTTTAVTGTVTVVANQSATATGTNSGDIINVKGGTVDTITANLSEKGGLGNTVTGGAISVTGAAATTSVTVNQTAAAAAAAASTATPGSVATGAVVAGPGLNGVTGVGVTAAPTTAKAAVAGVVDGAVTVQDANFGTTGANTITSVSLNNYGASSVINDNALANLSLSGTAGTLTITNATAGVATPSANSTLNLALNGLSAPTIVGGVVTAATGGNNTITDTNNEIATLNVTTATADSTLSGFADTGLKALNVSGTNVLTLGTVPTSLTSLTVTGGAGFNGDISLTGVTSFAPTSTGKITVTLDDTKQAFTGGAGQDVVTISADATKAITGGSGSNDEIILTGAAATYNATTAKLTNTNVTGFEVLGVKSASGTYDMSTLSSALKSIDVVSTTAALNFTKVVAGTNLAIDSASAAALSYQTADAAGASDSLNLTLGTATNTAGFITSSLTLTDANNVGLGTLNVVSNGSTFNTAHTISSLVDSGLSTLNVSGTAGLAITALNDSVTSLTVNNTGTGVAGVFVGTLTDATLGNLSFTGSNGSVVGELAGVTGKVLSISNTGTSTATISQLDTDANLTTLTLNGNVALNANSSVASTQAQGGANGLTVSGATDHAHVNLTVLGADATHTDSITLGNGNNLITDQSTVGTVNVTVGTGANLIDLSLGGSASAATNATYSATVALGAHTNTATLFDQVNVGVTGLQASGFGTAINGAVKGDVISFAEVGGVGGAISVGTLTTAQQAVITADATLAAAIGHAFGASTAAHQALSFQFQGNTYVIDNVGADTAFTAGTDTVVKLVGLHTIATSGVGHAIALAS